MKVLVISDGVGGKLSPSNWNTVSAAVIMAGGGSVDMCVLGASKEVQSLADEAALIEGVGRVLVIENDRLQHHFAEVEAPLLLALIEHCGGYDRVVVSATSYGKNLLPRLGALLDVQPLSDITGVEVDGIYERPIYAGNAVMRVRQKDSIHLVSIRSTAFAEASRASSGCTIEAVALEVTDIGDRIVFEGVDFSEHDRPELTTAKVVISGGRGMASGENFVLLEKVASKLNAAIGASRAAVDAGFASNDLQVGQTGKVVAPDLYIAVGISGAIQHLAGMKDSKVIVAINSDEDAPIFQVADYGLVADLFVALPDLEARLL